MDLTLTEDQELIQTTAGELLSSREPVAGARAVAADPLGYSTQLWKEMLELGWTGLALPEEYGGVGEGFLEACLLVEQLGRFAVPSPFVPTAICAGLPIARFGTDEQRETWLGAITQGRVLSYASGAGLAVSEGDGGYRLTGSAMFVPFADAAEDLLVVAEETVLLVDAAAPGITVEPLQVIGIDRRHRVSFDAVPVAADRRLGAADGPAVATAVHAYGTAATCAEMVGGAQRVLDVTVSYAKQREQFGKPIGAFQAVQHHCADMAIDVLTSRFIAYEAIWRLAEGLDATAEVSMAKAWVSEAYQRVCALGHQVHGAIGFTAEHDLHFYFRHAAASALAFGDADVHWGRLAALLEL